jgi:predicted extracellular nuclease
VDLPTPDATGSLALSGTGGQVILANSASAILQKGNLVGASGVVDAVGWGSSTTSYEGTAPAPSTTNAQSVTRTNGSDTDHNDVDFTLSGADGPTPQNIAGDGGGDGGGGTGSTPISIASIQGTNTDTSPYAGQTVTTQGVVTAAYPTGGFNGFFLETGGAGGPDADDQTPGASDAIFVFGSNSAKQVHIGDSVQVTGTVSEFQGETEIGSPTVTALPSALPAVVADQIPWSDLSTDAEKEAHEGELMAPQGDFTVSDNYDANWYGSFTLAAGDDALHQPTDVGKPGSAQAQAAVADNAARMVTLDDGSSMNYSSSANQNTPAAVAHANESGKCEFPRDVPRTGDS